MSLSSRWSVDFVERASCHVSGITLVHTQSFALRMRHPFPTTRELMRVEFLSQPKQRFFNLS
ncbi:MAG: hypothetical protein QNL68_07835 [Akkermansiaceae bacterium]|jgi:hypothetical protein